MTIGTLEKIMRSKGKSFTPTQCGPTPELATLTPPVCRTLAKQRNEM